MPVGLELGRWQGRLLPYLPQLPLEWAALALAVHGLDYRPQRPRPDSSALMVRSPALVTGAADLAAASLETWATPHRTPHAPSAESSGRQCVNPPAMWRARWLPSP